MTDDKQEISERRDAITIKFLDALSSLPCKSCNHQSAAILAALSVLVPIFLARKHMPVNKKLSEELAGRLIDAMEEWASEWFADRG